MLAHEGGRLNSVLGAFARFAHISSIGQSEPLRKRSNRDLRLTSVITPLVPAPSSKAPTRSPFWPFWPSVCVLPCLSASVPLPCLLLDPPNWVSIDVCASITRR